MNSFPYKLLDLTQTIDENASTWDGSCGFEHEIVVDYEDSDSETKFRVMKFRINAGIGTHMDAPNHCISGASTISDLNISDLCMPCSVIDVSSQAHERYSVTPDDIVAFENQFGQIPPNSCVMIRTGWDQFWFQPEQYRNNLLFPSVSPKAADLLLEREVYALGIDTLSPDRPEDGYRVHQAFLGRGKIIIENVANLSMLPPNGAFVMALPIKIKDATEAPIRLIGLIEQTKN